MNTERLQRILQKLKEKDLSQMIISDPLAHLLSDRPSD